MLLNVRGQGDSNLSIPQCVQVPVVEGEGSFGRPRTTAATQIIERLAASLGPGGGVVDSYSGAKVCRGSVTEVGEERQKSYGHGASPLGGSGIHLVEYEVSLGIGDSLDPGLGGFLIGKELCPVSHGVDFSPQELVQRDMSYQQAADASGESLRTVDPLHIREQGEVEVVHRYEDDGEIGLVVCDHPLKEPTSHAGGVPWLAHIEDLCLCESHFMKGGFGDIGDALVVFHAPAKDGGVSHQRNPNLAIFTGFGCGDSEAVSVGADLEIMGLAHPLHEVALEVGRHAPLAHCVGSEGRRNPGQACPHFGQAQQTASKEQAQEQAGGYRGRFPRHRGHLSRMVIVWLLAVCSVLVVPTAQADVNLTLRAFAEEGELRSTKPGTITAKLRWLGKDRSVPLVQGDDGVWSAKVSGPQVRAMGVELWLHDREPALRVSQGLEIMPQGDSEFAWTVGAGPHGAAWRLSDAESLSDLRRTQETTSLLASLWALGVIILVLLLGRRALARSDEIPLRRVGPVWVQALLWVGFAVVWTWPSAWPGTDVVGRHFDTLGTVWVIDAATRLGFDLHDPFSAWPTGATYSAMDSWLLLLVSWVGSFTSPQTLHAWLAVIGVASSGLAASFFAKEVGAASPTHHIAGLFFAGSGLMASALLEGHVYQALNPWLPMMALFLWRAAREGGRLDDGVFAGLCFAAALYSSGYLGVSAGIVALGIALPGLMSAEDRRPLLVAGAVACVALVAYLALFGSAGTPGASHTTIEGLRMGSLSANSIGPPTREVDRFQHSWALALSALMVALAVIGLWANRSKSWPLIGVVLAAIVIALGPDWGFGIAPAWASIPSPLSILWDLPAVRYLRFPGRVMWAAIFALSILAALGASTISRRMGQRAMSGIFILLLVELVWTVGLPFRQRSMVADVPEVYWHAKGAVFDLVGEGASTSRESDSWMSAILCQYQTVHGRPIADDCVAVGADVNPRTTLSRWVSDRLYEGNRGAVFSYLGSLGFTALAVHYDWLDEADRLRIRAALTGSTTFTETRLAEGVGLTPFGGGEGTVVASSASPTRLVGPPVAGDIDWNLRVDLLIPRTRRKTHYYLRVQDQRPVELLDVAGLPGDQYDDGTYSCTSQLSVNREVFFQLLEEENNIKRVLWSGPVVPLNISEDRITFRMDEAGRVAPLLRSLDTFSGTVPSQSARIIAVGWLLSFIFIAWWWLWMRRKASVQAQEANHS